MTNQLSLRDLPPEEIIQAAQKISRWFAERNITDWKLDGCESRKNDSYSNQSELITLRETLAHNDRVLMAELVERMQDEMRS